MTEWSDINGATSPNYIAPCQTEGAFQFRCVVRGVITSANSNSITVNVYGIPTRDSIQVEYSSNYYGVNGFVQPAIEITSPRTPDSVEVSGTRKWRDEAGGDEETVEGYYDDGIITFENLFNYAIEPIATIFVALTFGDVVITLMLYAVLYFADTEDGFTFGIGESEDDAKTNAENNGGYELFSPI